MLLTTLRTRQRTTRQGCTQVQEGCVCAAHIYLVALQLLAVVHFAAPSQPGIQCMNSSTARERCRGLFKKEAAVRVCICTAQRPCQPTGCWSQHTSPHTSLLLPPVPPRVSVSRCCTTAAGVLAATGILTGVYYATPKETKDRIRRRVKKTTDE